MNNNNTTQQRTFSPRTTINQAHLLKNTEVVSLINSLSSIMQSYFNLTKVSISDIKKFLPINQHSNIDSITLMLMSFINESKDIFKKLKDIPNDLNDNKFTSPQQPKVLLNKSRNYSKPRLFRQSSPVKTLTSLINSSINGRNILFPESYNRNSFKTNEPLKENNDTERALSLANGVIYFLSQIKQFEELILKKTGDIEKKKKQFDNVKNDLMDLAQDILQCTQKQQYQEQVQQLQNRPRLQSKGSENTHSNKEYIKVNSTQLSQSQSQKSNKRSIKKMKELNDNHIKLTSTNNDTGLAMLNKLKLTIKDLRQENNELNKTIKDQSLLITSNSGTNVLLNKLKEKEEEIKVLTKRNLKISVDKYKCIYNNSSKPSKKSSSKNKRMSNSDLFFVQIEKREDKDKLIKELQQHHNNNNDDKYNDNKNNETHDDQFDSNGLVQDISLSRKRLSSKVGIERNRRKFSDKGNSTSKKENEIISNRFKRYNSNETFTFNNNSNSEIQGSEIVEKLNKQIVEIDNELIRKTKEIDKLIKENSDKNREIAACIKDFHQIKSDLEVKINNLKKVIENKTKENDLLINEVKVLNDQLGKINMPIKQNALLIKNHTLEYKKIQDELFKERKEKTELLNLKKQLNQNILKLQNDIVLKNKEIDKFSKREFEKENIALQNKPLKVEIDNSRITQSKLFNTSSINNNNIIDELKGKDVVLEYIKIKEEMLKYKNDRGNLEKENEMLNKQIEDKDCMIIQLKLQNITSNNKKDGNNSNDNVNIIRKEESFRRSKSLDLNGSLNELKEAIDINSNGINTKDDIIFDLNNKINQLNKLKRTYKDKIDQLTLSLDIYNNENKEKIIELKAKLSSLQSDYDNQKTILDNKIIELNQLKANNIINEKGLTSNKDISINQRQEDIGKEISHETNRILCDKTYNNLHWYLMTPKSKTDLNNKDSIQYDNTYWIEATKIDNHINKYNKFKTEREIEQETYDQMNTIQSRLLKKLEEKDDEVMRIQSTIEKIKDNQKAISTSNNDSLLNKGFNNNLLSPRNNLLSSRSNHLDNDSNFVLIGKYEKLLAELNEAKDKLALSNNHITKLTNDNKELTKIANDKTLKMLKIEPCLSDINPNNEVKSVLSFSDENVFQSDILNDSKGNHISEINNYIIETDKDKDKDKDDNIQMKNLILLLINELTLTKKIKRLIYQICKLIGYSDEEALRMIVEKEKKGGLLRFFKKK